MWGRLFRKSSLEPTRVERWDTPDGDFLDIHRLDSAQPGAVRFLLLHGLEGTIRSHYAQGILREARTRGWAANVLIFRSCGDELNRTERFYHSGETSDVALVVDRILEESPADPLVLAGVSLGGNVLLKYLGEAGNGLNSQIKAAATISVPFDLARASRYISQGFSRIYQWHFIRSLKRKAALKLERFPGFVSESRLDKATTMYEFDDVVTAPVHGFRDADDYYSRSSSLGWLGRISIPTLLLNSEDDPFLPREVLGEVRSVAAGNPHLTVEFPTRGGHVGFIAGNNPLRPSYYAEWRVCQFLADKLVRNCN